MGRMTGLGVALVMFAGSAFFLGEIQGRGPVRPLTSTDLQAVRGGELLCWRNYFHECEIYTGNCTQDGPCPPPGEPNALVCPRLGVITKIVSGHVDVEKWSTGYQSYQYMEQMFCQWDINCRKNPCIEVTGGWICDQPTSGEMKTLRHPKYTGPVTCPGGL